MAQAVASEKHIKTVREILGLEPGDFEFVSASSAAAPAAPDLPVAEEIFGPEEPVNEQKEELVLPKIKPAPEITLREYDSPVSRLFAKDWIRYPLIFLVAFGFFYVVLNFGAISKQVSSMISNPAKHDVASVGQSSPDYAKWTKKYYVYVSDSQILLGNNDPDGDGLTNLQEYNLGTNPLVPDTDRDGYSDGQEILNGYNPLYQGALTANQQDIINREVDREAVASRNRLGSLARVAGDSISTSGSLPIDTFQVDPTKPGNIKIVKIGVDAPVIWSKEFMSMNDDLKYGTAHHPGTVYPGEKGTASIHGHSSGYPWDGSYKTVFTKLNYLETGDEVLLTVYSTKGESRQYRFIVRSKQVFAKDDPGQFADLGGYHLNLSTSWPVGTARERYVVTTELVGI